MNEASPPKLSVGSVHGVESSVQGGCGTAFYGTDAVGGDQCGPFLFGAVLRSTPISVSAGQAIPISAPSTYALYVIDAGLAIGWSVEVAPAANLKGVEDDQAAGLPAELARTLARGRGPDTTMHVRAPSTAGAFVLQVAASVVRDGWTFADAFWYWLIRVH